MDRDLITRVVLCCVLVFCVLASVQTGFHNNVVAPLAVIGVAAVMFWPRSKTAPEQEAETIE